MNVVKPPGGALVIAALLYAACLALPMPAGALTACGAGHTFSVDTTLNDDYYSSYALNPCITLTNGADLNMNGHKIYVDVFYFSQEAIKCTSSSSRVHGGRIEGPFVYGIRDCEDIDHVVIERREVDTAVFLGPIVGIWNDFASGFDQVTNNLIYNHSTGIFGHKVLGSTSNIKDNHIIAATGIDIEGTSSGNGPTIDKNVIEFTETAILKDNASHLRIGRNLLIGKNTNDPPMPCMDINLANTTVDDNYCECSDQCPIVPPYVLPFY